MNKVEKEFLIRLSIFAGLKLALYIFIAKAAKAARKAAKNG